MARLERARHVRRHHGHDRRSRSSRLAQHVSQGGAEAEPWVRLRAEQTGEQAGYTYAEAFKAFRFVDDDEDE